MKNKAKIIKQVLVGSALLSALIGCGSSGASNDQGVSFTLYGLFQENTCTTGLSGAGIPLSTDPESNGSGVGVLASLGLQNNMAQGLRTRRIYLSYFVEGATVQPPATSQALGVVLAPGYDSPDSSLPDGFGGAGSNIKNTSCSEFELIPPEIISYLNLNRDKFPELPYKMSVEVKVSGIGTAGDEYTTNTLDIPIEVVQDNIIAPTPADPTGDGTSSGVEDGTTTTDGTSEVTEGGEVIPVIPGTDLPAS